MYLIFDTETTGLPKNWRAPISDTENWPRCVQLAWQVHDELGNLIESKSYIVKPDDYDIPFESEKIHGISTLLAEKEGVNLDDILNEFNDSISKSKFIIGHNVNFDLNVIGCEFYRSGLASNIELTDVLDTCTELTAELCKLPGGRGGKFKLPTFLEVFLMICIAESITSGPMPSPGKVATFKIVSVINYFVINTYKLAYESQNSINFILC